MGWSLPPRIWVNTQCRQHPRLAVPRPAWLQLQGSFPGCMQRLRNRVGLSGLAMQWQGESLLLRNKIAHIPVFQYAQQYFGHNCAVKGVTISNITMEMKTFVSSQMRCVHQHAWRALYIYIYGVNCIYIYIWGESKIPGEKSPRVEMWGDWVLW